MRLASNEILRPSVVDELDGAATGESDESASTNKEVGVIASKFQLDRAGIDERSGGNFKGGTIINVDSPQIASRRSCSKRRYERACGIDEKNIAAGTSANAVDRYVGGDTDNDAGSADEGIFGIQRNVAETPIRGVLPALKTGCGEVVLCHDTLR